MGQPVVMNVAVVHAPLLKNLSLLINKKDNKKAIKIFLLEYSCCTMLCLFLLHSKVNHYMVVYLFFVVQLFSCVQLFATPWTAAHQASLSFTIFRSLLRFMSVESMMPSSVVSFSSRLQSFPALGSFPRSPFFASCG